MSRFSRTTKRALALVGAGLLSGGLVTITSAEAFAAAPQVTITIGKTDTVKESAGTAFACPTDQILIGRAHQGDANGSTTYWCGVVHIDGQQVKTTAPVWSEAQKENASFFSAPAGSVMVGRAHTGDAAGQTKWATTTLTVAGKPVRLAATRWTRPRTEADSRSRAARGEVMMGMQHSGDHNGDTRYQYALLGV